MFPAIRRLWPMLPRPEIPSGAKEFRSAPFHFSILYPEGMTVQVYKEKGKAFTAAFEDDKAREELDVFVLPYAEQQITARFKVDEPSGVFKEPHDITVDGVRATTFFGHNPTIGDTREVWFIHGGYLYEVMTDTR